MHILVRRERFNKTSTIGRLFINGQFQCFTLEDAVREKPGVPVAKWKVQNETAIPVGKYRLIVNMSNRFKRRLPLLLDVPGYAGVRIHAGNTEANTEGCILLGRKTNFVTISESQLAMQEFMPKLEAALAQKQNITITVEGLRHA